MVGGSPQELIESWAVDPNSDRGLPIPRSVPYFGILYLKYHYFIEIPVEGQLADCHSLSYSAVNSLAGLPRVG